MILVCVQIPWKRYTIGTWRRNSKIRRHNEELNARVNNTRRTSERGKRRHGLDIESNEKRPRDGKHTLCNALRLYKYSVMLGHISGAF